jgi:methylase of polypeptide subunit release factors
MHHDIFLQLLDGELYEAPIKKPLRIMDVGTGTGIWAIDMADKFPEAEVIGVDLRYGPNPRLLVISMDTAADVA